jgi:hypothetical protein
MKYQFLYCAGEAAMESRDRTQDLSDVEIDCLDSSDESSVELHGEPEQGDVPLVPGEPAAVARKRSLQRTSFSKSTVGSKRTRLAHGSTTTPTNVTAAQLVNELFAADCGKLVCRVCHIKVSLKMLQAAVGNNQESMLEDQMEVTLKLQYNRGTIALR